MNTPVNFETAKMLKEKGFDKICYRAFLYRTYQPSNIYEENIEAIKNAENYSNSEYEKYYRPTIAEAVMWLYKNHRIWIYVEMTGSEQFYPRYRIIDSEDKHHVGDFKIMGERLIFNSPTEAYKESIKYCLTKIL